MRKTKPDTQPQENEGGNVHFLQPLKEIPDPTLPLGKEGKAVYVQWCRTLLKSGMLTLKSSGYVELLALATDDAAFFIGKGKRPPRQAYEAIRAARQKLEKLDANQTLATPGGGESIYAAFGFAKRARAARQAQD